MTFSRFLIKSKQRFWIEIIKSRKSYVGFLKFTLLIATFLFVVLLIILKLIQYNNDPLSITRPYFYVEPPTSFFRFAHNKDGELKDWHNYEQIKYEASRTGPGEQGKPFTSILPNETKLNQELFDVNGYYGLVSDKISINRSVPDLRHPDCKNKKYLNELPTVSVVIPFYNDHLSTLLRTVYSIINRSPPELLKEIILVNDHSTKDFLYGELSDYIEKNLKNIVKLYVLPRRSGLIWARLAGARAASGDVLIFLDSHTEANVNWLPPLLDPIARDYRTSVSPLIDIIDFKTYEYRGQDDGSRGVFDWDFNYRKIPLQPHHQKSKSDPFPNPVMVGGLFAISTKFFWELGGYDTGLDIWGGEQYELSFKIWLCGGKLLDIPCSRVAHVYRGGMPFPNDRKGIDFITINYKRVAEVWMDDYKKIIYGRDPDRYGKADTGDLTYQFYIKKRQQCKPFKYFIDEVAPDMLERFPMVEKPPFASGTIQSVAHKDLCIDTMARGKEEPLGMYPCAQNKTSPQGTQFFVLRYYRDINIKRTMNCFDSSGSGIKRDIITYACHHGQGNQYFRYDLESKKIYHGVKRNNHCVDMDAQTRTVFVTNCNENSLTQQWKWGFANKTNLNNWLTYGVKIEDKKEIADLSKEYNFN